MIHKRKELIIMKKTYKIEVDCANCANKMEEAANKTEGVKSAVVNFMALKMTVEFNEGMRLAFIGSINDEILVFEELAYDFIDYIKAMNLTIIEDYYKIEDKELSNHELLKAIAFKRGCLLKGGEPDILKASQILIDDFRSGNLGKISLERPM